jgi:hypothetical protein
VLKVDGPRVRTGSLEPHFFTQNSQNYFFMYRAPQVGGWPKVLGILPSDRWSSFIRKNLELNTKSHLPRLASSALAHNIVDLCRLNVPRGIGPRCQRLKMSFAAGDLSRFVVAQIVSIQTAFRLNHKVKALLPVDLNDDRPVGIVAPQWGRHFEPGRADARCEVGSV